MLLRFLLVLLFAILLEMSLRRSKEKKLKSGKDKLEKINTKSNNDREAILASRKRRLLSELLKSDIFMEWSLLLRQLNNDSERAIKSTEQMLDERRTNIVRQISTATIHSELLSTVRTINAELRHGILILTELIKLANNQIWPFYILYTGPESIKVKLNNVYNSKSQLDLKIYTDEIYLDLEFIQALIADENWPMYIKWHGPSNVQKRIKDRDLILEELHYFNYAPKYLVNLD